MRRCCKAIYFAVGIGMLGGCGYQKSNDVAIRIDTVDSDIQRMVYTIDANGLALEEETYIKDTITDRYVLCGRTVNTYNEQGKVTSQEIFLPDLADMKLKPLERDEYSYDSIGRILEQISSVASDSPHIWTYVSRTTSRYIDTMLALKSVYTWNPNNESWFKTNESHYVYDTLGRLQYRLDFGRDIADTSKIIKDIKEFFYPNDTIIW